MKDLSSFFDNPFSDPRIVLDSKKKYGEDAINRMTTQNAGGVLTAELAAAEAAQKALFGEAADVEISRSISEARTETVDALIDKFVKRNSKLNQYLVLGEVDNTPAYQEIFPQGVGEMTRKVNKGNVEQKLAFMVAAIGNNAAVAGGAAVLAEYKQLLDDYKTARKQQLGKFSETSTGRSERDAAEVAWDDAMFAALLTAAKLNRNQPEKLSLYCNQSILRTPTFAATDGKGRITGVATQKGAPLQSLKVHVVDGNIDDEMTDSQGRYTTNSLPVGTYKLEFFMNELLVQTDTIQVVDNGNTGYNLAL